MRHTRVHHFSSSVSSVDGRVTVGHVAVVEYIIHGVDGDVDDDVDVGDNHAGGDANDADLDVGDVLGELDGDDKGETQGDMSGGGIAMVGSLPRLSIVARRALIIAIRSAFFTSSSCSLFSSSQRSTQCFSIKSYR